ncbi:MAG: hypothetical protein EBV48_01535 [Betaproteobacteria bacterium]|nr:hypothetical protein [Betaproteobacteria bacterium]NCU94555.1 hypothetical protein [Betaproteobacteria bacterium]NDF69664.1 hypothetical protein [Betaproteobacteria bacterium]
MAMEKLLSIRQAAGRAQIARLEEEYAGLLAAPLASSHAQMLLGWLESILEVGTSQLLWERSLSRAIEELEALRKRGAWSASVAAGLPSYEHSPF